MAFNTQIVLSDTIIVLDAARAVNPEFPSRATQFPIEDGSSESDHIINDNMKLGVEGVITNAGSFFGLVFTSNTTKEAYQALLRAREDRSVVEVITELDTFSNMAITNISFPRDNETGDSLELIINFEQITISTSSFVNEEPTEFSSGISDDASGTETLGSQGATEITDDSLTSNLSDLVSNIFSE